MKQPLLNPEEISRKLAELNANPEQSWQIDNGVLSKTFRFQNFVHAFGFMTQVAIEAEKLNHHPDWSNVYRTVNIQLTTHDSGGITELDFALASRMESICNH